MSTRPRDEAIRHSRNRRVRHALAPSASQALDEAMPCRRLASAGHQACICIACICSAKQRAAWHRLAGVAHGRAAGAHRCSRNRAAMTYQPPQQLWQKQLRSHGQTYVAALTLTIYPHTPNSPSSKLRPARPACRPRGDTAAGATWSRQEASPAAQFERRLADGHGMASTGCTRGRSKGEGPSRLGAPAEPPCKQMRAS